jgi:hypothetical protein
MKLLTFLYELSDVLGALTAVESVRLIPLADGCQIVCNGEEREKSNEPCVMYTVQAKTNETVEDLPYTIGIPSMQGVKGMLKAPGLVRSTATAVFKPNARVPRIVLGDPIGNSYELALYRKELAESEIKVAPLKKNYAYEVVAAPTDTGIALFKHWAREARKRNEKNRFTPFTTLANQLVFRHQNGLEKNDFLFADNVIGVLNPDWNFRDKDVLPMLSLYSTSKSMRLKFYSGGLLTIELQTTLATYLFHFPAGKN